MLASFTFLAIYLEFVAYTTLALLCLSAGPGGDHFLHHRWRARGFEGGARTPSILLNDDVGSPSCQLGSSQDALKAA